MCLFCVCNCVYVFVKHLNICFLYPVSPLFNLSLKVSRWNRHLQFKARVRREGERQRERQRQTREMLGLWEWTIVSKTVNHISSFAGTSKNRRQWNPCWTNSSCNPCNSLKEFRNSKWKKQIFKGEGASSSWMPADTGEHGPMTFFICINHSYLVFISALLHQAPQKPLVSTLMF